MKVKADDPRAFSLPHVCPEVAPDFPPRLQGDELVAWVRAGMRIEQAVAQREAIGIMALQQRRCSPEEWQIDPDGHIRPRQDTPSSSESTPPPATGESRPHPGH